MSGHFSLMSFPIRQTTQVIAVTDIFKDGGN
jgi:hypothetical protein